MPCRALSSRPTRITLQEVSSPGQKPVPLSIAGLSKLPIRPGVIAFQLSVQWSRQVETGKTLGDTRTAVKLGA